MTTKDTWIAKKADCETPKTMNDCQVKIGGSVKYGMGGKWTKGGDQYLALNGHLSRTGMPKKLKTKDGDIPISQTDFNKLVDAGFVKGQSAVEFDK